MKRVYITPMTFVQNITMTSVIASSMYLSQQVVSDVDELAVKSASPSANGVQWSDWDGWDIWE